MAGAGIHLLRYHRRSAVRVVWRLNAPLLGAIAIGAGLSPAPEAFLAAAFGVPPAAQAAWFGWLVVAFASVLAAGRRLRLTDHSWIDHLPIGAATARTARWWALVWAQLPIAFCLTIAWLAGALAGLPISPLRWVVMLITICALATIGWPFSARERVVRGRHATRWPLGWVLAWRAVGVVAFVPAGLALLPVGAAWLFENHSQPLSAYQRGIFERGMVLVAVVGLLAAGADLLGRQRSPWRWSRSLPWSARQRVTFDAVWLLLPASIPLVAAGLLLPALTTLAVLACVPALAFLAVAAARRATVAGGGAGIELLWIGGFVIGLVSLSGSLALVCLLFAPLARRWAEHRDRSQPVSLWDERSEWLEESA